MALWGVGVMLGPILGPTIGGYMTELYNWRWVFFVVAPFGVVALFGRVAFVPVDRTRLVRSLGTIPNATRRRVCAVLVEMFASA